MSGTDTYAVFGNPIRHSRSPWIHRAFARQCHEVLRYRAVKVAEGGFAKAAAEFFAAGGKGQGPRRVGNRIDLFQDMGRDDDDLV